MSLFHHVSFQPIDPLGDGLREEILAEQQEPEAITNLADIDGEELVDVWNMIAKDVDKDPTWSRDSEG